MQYEIVVAGHLMPRWSAWFDGFDITNEADGSAVLRGFVVDQAALHGVLQRLRDIGIPLISLTPIDSTDGRAAPEPETEAEAEGN